MNISELRDMELLKKFQNGCSDSFEELTVRYEGKVFALAKQTAQTDEDAEAVLCEVFIRLHGLRKSFQHRAQLANWLHNVVVEEAAKLTPVKVEKEVVSQNKLAQELIQMEMQKLPEELHKPFMLRFMLGLSVKETSTVMSISEEEVKARLGIARRIIRGALIKTVELGAHCQEDKQVVAH